MSKTGLGRGLNSLLGGGRPQTKTRPRPVEEGDQTGASGTTAPAPQPSVEAQDVLRVPLKKVRPSPLQPRRDFSDDALRELADSIREQGILQPLVVRTNGDEYELIAGERRLRAARLAGKTEVPVMVLQADDREALEMALVENLQRDNLNPMEESRGYAQLIEQHGLKQEEVAARVGKSRATVANALRLLNLADEVGKYVRDGLLSTGHAKALLSINTPSDQAQAARRVIRKGLSVRQTEDLVSGMGGRRAGTAVGRKTASAAASRDAHVSDLENRLRERLGARVNLRYRKGRGSVEIKFVSDEDLQRILDVLGVGTE